MAINKNASLARQKGKRDNFAPLMRFQPKNKITMGKKKEPVPENLMSASDIIAPIIPALFSAIMLSPFFLA